MKFFAATTSGTALVLACVVAAHAAEPARPTPANPPQIAADPGGPYSYGRLPGPKISPNNWIPSPYSSASPSAATPSGEPASAPYSAKGFGPKPN
jgi:hypothetical protein